MTYDVGNPALKNDFDRYQDETVCTAAPLEGDLAKAIWALGLAGESGEVIELVKKNLGHGHKMDAARLSEELGDVLWYLSVLASNYGLRLSEIADKNIEKLKKRYAKGAFSQDESKNRDKEAR